MRFTKIIFLIICFGAFNWMNLNAQDPHFSQLSQTQNAVNPAFTGIMYGPRAVLHYRSQYPRIGAEVNSGFNTVFGSYDQFISPLNSGLGIQILNDRFGAGLMSRFSLELMYAYQLKLSPKNAIRFGLSGNYNRQQIDYSNLRFFDQIHPILGFSSGLATNEEVSDAYNTSYFNFNAGMLYFTNDYYFGISARNLLPKKDFFSSEHTSRFAHTLISLQVGAHMRFGPEQKYVFAPLLQFDRQYGYQKLVGNFIFGYDIFNAGLGFRHNFNDLESISLIAGFTLKNIRISYSYDVVTNALKSYSGGSHEIGIRFLLNGDDTSLAPNSEKEIMYCPDVMKF
jgi:type IX secretion system PorP/SprF family membrane protein